MEDTLIASYITLIIGYLSVENKVRVNVAVHVSLTDSLLKLHI